jgi:hypothetical protein
MDASASRDMASKAPQLKNSIPPLTFETLRRELGLKSMEEIKTYLSSVKDRKTLLAGLYQNNPDLEKEAPRLQEELDELYKTFESKSSWMSKSWDFVKRNKWKLLIGGLLVAGGATAGYYYWPQIATWGAGISESAKAMTLKWLGLSAPAVPAVPGIPEAAGGLGDMAGPIIEAGPAPHEVIDPSSAGGILDALGGK